MKEIIYRNMNGELERHQFNTKDAALFTIRGLLHLELSDFEGNEQPVPVEVGGEVVEGWRISKQPDFAGDCWFRELHEKSAEELEEHEFQSKDETSPDKGYWRWDHRIKWNGEKLGHWIRENGLAKPMSVARNLDPNHTSNGYLAGCVKFWVPVWDTGLTRNDGSEITRELWFDPELNANPRAVLYVESDDYGIHTIEFYGYRARLTDWYYLVDLLDRMVCKPECDDGEPDLESVFDEGPSDFDMNDEGGEVLTDAKFDGGAPQC